MHESQTQRALSRKAFWLVIGFSFLIFFAQTRSFKLLLDGLTYTALSKNILATGDWKRLHYSEVAYPDFYQHPPLAMWIQAIIYKIFGFSESISRAFSSGCGVLSVALVFSFSKKFAGLPAALWGAVVLFTYTRFIKWGTNFYLDGIVGFFALLGICLWLLGIYKEKDVTKKDIFFSFFGGIFLAAAVMTKGVVAFGALAAIPVSLVFFFSRQNLAKLLILLAGLLLPFFLWFQFGDGYEYFRNYYLAATTRGSTHQLARHPWRNLYTTWHPWFLVYLFSLISFARAFIKKEFTSEFKITGVLLFFSLTYPLGFSLGLAYFEHYMTPFYPVGALLVGMQLAKLKWFSKITERGISLGYGILIVAALFVATIAPNFHVVKDLAPMQWVYEIQRLPEAEQSRIKQIAFTNAATDVYYGLANILGKTDFKAYGSFNLSQPAMNDTILITSRDEVPDRSWKQVSCFYIDGFRAYVSKDLPICERQ